MKVLSSWGLLTRSTAMLRNGTVGGSRMSRLPFMGLCCIMMLLILYRTMICQYMHKEREDRLFPFDSMKEIQDTNVRVGNLPRGIVEKNSDMELKPLWFHRATEQKDAIQTHRNLLAISAGIKQKHNVDIIVTKFLAENFTVILFHYDGYVDGWHDLTWSSKAIHVVAHNQTKWWFAKRFLHPDVVSVYDYVFLWDEDLVVDHFHPGRYLRIMESEGLEISQPALDAELSEVHHRITMRRKSAKLHRRVYDHKGSKKCTDASEGPPCTGWVEGMAPVFSRSAWRCAWHLIQNDLIHGWGMDMKLGYCVQGERSKKVGVIDSEYVVHLGIRTLGGPSAEIRKSAAHDDPKLRRSKIDMRSEIRRQSTLELGIFRRRWDKAVREDSDWVDPFLLRSSRRKR